jgi:hypothetical protein
MQELLGCAGVRVTMIHTPVPNRNVRGVGSPADVLRAGSAWITASGCSECAEPGRGGGGVEPRRSGGHNVGQALWRPEWRAEPLSVMLPRAASRSGGMQYK